MFRYRYDTETGLYYLQSRYYNPTWGRFINAYAIGGEMGTLLSHNMFLYCFNNPINLEDPSGCWPTLGQIFKAATIVAVTAVTVAVVAAAPVVASMAGLAAGIYISAGAMATASTIATVGCAAVATGVAVCGINRAVESVSGKNYGASLLGDKTYNNIEASVNMAAVAIGSAPQHGSYPSTAKKSPQNLNEQIALKAAKMAPSSGIVLEMKMNDARMPYWVGWQKYSMVFKNPSGTIDVHYIGNKFIPIFFDFKIK